MRCSDAPQNHTASFAESEHNHVRRCASPWPPVLSSAHALRRLGHPRLSISRHLTSEFQHDFELHSSSLIVIHDVTTSLPSSFVSCRIIESPNHDLLGYPWMSSSLAVGPADNYNIECRTLSVEYKSAPYKYSPHCTRFVFSSCHRPLRPITRRRFKTSMRSTSMLIRAALRYFAAPLKPRLLLYMLRNY
jgi:hypothetical protein